MEALPDYVPDTLVVATDEEPTMHIQGDDGFFHRHVTIGAAEAIREHFACGPLLDFRLRQRTERETLNNWPLCRLCFSPFEIAESERRKFDRDRIACGSRPIPTIKGEK